MSIIIQRRYLSPPNQVASAIQYTLVESFKSAVDADDTNAFTRAIAGGYPILLGARTYSISGLSVLNTTASLSIKGIPGQSVVQRNAANGSAFITIASPSVSIEGVTFDFNSGSISANQYGVLIQSTLTQTIRVVGNVFKNNSGTVGGGLAILGQGTTDVGSFEVRGNEFTNFTWNACYLGSAQNGLVTGNYIHDCSLTTCAGIQSTVSGTASATNLARDIIVTDNRVERCWRGISAGGAAAPYTLGTPGAAHISIMDNLLQDIANYAIVAQGEYLNTVGNRINQSVAAPSVFTGIGYYGRYGLISDNSIVYAGASFGIDCGGCNDVTISNNRVNMASGSSINAGGGQNMSVLGNTINGSGTNVAITIYEVEGDGAGTAFPNFCSNLIVDGNIINRNGGSTIGIATFDNPGGRSGANSTRITNNKFYNTGGASQATALQLVGGGTGAYIEGNTVNDSTVHFVNPNGSGDVIYNEVFDVVSTFAGTATKVRAIVPDLINTYNAGGSVLWVYPTAGGSGYTSQTTLSASGGAGTGWAGTALINNGVIVGVKTTAKGTGYSGSITITATDPGGGSGATFAATNFPTPYSDRKISFKPTSAANVVMASGGALSLYAGYPIYVRVGDVLKLRAGLNTTKWIIEYEPHFTFAESFVASALTNSSAETALATITIPANMIGLNMALKVTAYWSGTSSANSKTIRARLGGLTGTQMFSTAFTTGNILKSETIIGNRNSASSQYTHTQAPRGSDGLVTTQAATGAVDTTANQDLVLSGQLATSTETLTLEGYTVEVVR